VFRENWRDRQFWTWWWQSPLSHRFRSGAAVGSCILIGAAGAYSALELSSANATGPSDVTVLHETVVRATTVHTTTTTQTGAGRVVVHYVRVEPKPVRSRTRTTVVTVKHMVTHRILVPHTVTIERTITRAIPRVKTRTVVEQTTQTTPPVTVTAPSVTQIETLPAQTVVVTVTVKQHGHS
jgi:hypothetical protein